MLSNTPISAVLFDLDDTLNDRQLSWNAFVPGFQREYADRLGSCDVSQISRAIAAADGGGYRNKNEFFTEISQTLPWIEPPTAEDIEKFWRGSFAACIVERAGARALLADLRNHEFRIGIVSNGQTDMQTAKIAHLGFDSLADVVLISETVGIKKPDPKIFQMALEMLECDAASTLFVGDHPVLDVAGGYAAGIAAAWLCLGREWTERTVCPTHIISTLAELRPIIGLESFQK
jgi:putative hydrolase of the HAD superfamily